MKIFFLFTIHFWPLDLWLQALYSSNPRLSKLTNLYSPPPLAAIACTLKLLQMLFIYKRALSSNRFPQ